ncbi:MAG TPA: GNAT family N-acetyltransferase [Chthonomonadaceae bacterium]|nr:GNAT family N-acetyltransferase [Chthonomonadaceae bacterium]
MEDSEASWEQERARLRERVKALEPVRMQSRSAGAEIRIAPATIEEAAIVHRIMRAAFAEYAGRFDPPSGAFRETVEDVVKAMQEGGAILAWEGSEAAGTARFRIEPDHMYVGRVGVLPSFRGRGIGAAIMAYLETIARAIARPDIRLGTRQALSGNIAFYQHHGYEITEIRQHPRGTDQIVLFHKKLSE